MGGVSKDAPRVAAMARAILQVVYKNHHVTNTAASEYALEHQAVLEQYLPIARKYTPAVGAAFAWAHQLGWEEVPDAAHRLLEQLWDTPGDPLRALEKRRDDFKNKQGQRGIEERFAMAINTLKAVHEGRELKTARSTRPDYTAIERASMAPKRQSKIEYEPGTDGEEDPPQTPEELAKARAWARSVGLIESEEGSDREVLELYQQSGAA